MIMITDTNKINMRKTRQKDLILKIVLNSSDHPSAEMVYERARKLLPDISLGTVYRNLNQLAAMGKIRKIPIASGSDRFDKTLATHAHFHCYGCETVTDIADGICKNLKETVQKETDAEIDQCDVLFEGKCKKCLEEKNA